MALSSEEVAQCSATLIMVHVSSHQGRPIMNDYDPCVQMPECTYHTYLCSVIGLIGVCVLQKSGSTVGDESGSTVGDESGSTVGDESGSTVGDESSTIVGDGLPSKKHGWDKMVEAYDGAFSLLMHRWPYSSFSIINFNLVTTSINPLELSQMFVNMSESSAVWPRLRPKWDMLIFSA